MDHPRDEAMEKKRTRVLCIDDHAIVGRGLRASISLEPDLDWAGWRPSADDLVDAVDESRADVVLIDVDMPGADPFKELEQLHELRERIRSLVFSAYVRDRYIDAAVASGAWGFISKGEEFEAILDAVRRVARGEFAYDGEVMERCEIVDGRLRPKRGSASSLSGLTPREVQVLRMIAQGMSTKDIAEQIHRSVKRVESIRTTMMRKLDCEDRLELTRYAIREGLVEP